MTYVDKLSQDPEFRKLYIQESFVIDAMELICRLMNQGGISIDEMADRLLISRKRLHKAFQGDIDLRTMAMILTEMGYQPLFGVRKINGEAQKPC